MSKRRTYSMHAMVLLALVAFLAIAGGVADAVIGEGNSFVAFLIYSGVPGLLPVCAIAALAMEDIALTKLALGMGVTVTIGFAAFEFFVMLVGCYSDPANPSPCDARGTGAAYAMVLYGSASVIGLIALFLPFTPRQESPR